MTWSYDWNTALLVALIWLSGGIIVLVAAYLKRKRERAAEAARDAVCEGSWIGQHPDLYIVDELDDWQAAATKSTIATEPWDWQKEDAHE